jgi:preprotein translocase subunit Sss1
MMNTNLLNTPANDEGMETRLWEYIDGFSTSEEKSVIEKLIAENAEWRAKYHELLEVHQSLNLVELEEPSLRFTKNVMEQIAKYQIAPATKTYINSKIIWGIGIFFLTMIVGFLIYGIGQIDWTEAGDSKSTLGVDLSKVDYSQMFNSNLMNGVMMLNVVLGLVLLDRYLSNKNKRLKDA